MLRSDKTHRTKSWMRHDENVWFIEPKDKLYQWREILSLLLGLSQALFIINDIVAVERFDKRRQSLLELAILGRY